MRVARLGAVVVLAALALYGPTCTHSQLTGESADAPPLTPVETQPQTSVTTTSPPPATPGPTEAVQPNAPVPANPPAPSPASPPPASEPASSPPPPPQEPAPASTEPPQTPPAPSPIPNTPAETPAATPTTTAASSSPPPPPVSQPETSVPATTPAATPASTPATTEGEPGTIPPTQTPRPPTETNAPQTIAPSTTTGSPPPVSEPNETGSPSSPETATPATTPATPPASTPATTEGEPGTRPPTPRPSETNAPPPTTGPPAPGSGPNETGSPSMPETATPAPSPTVSSSPPAQPPATTTTAPVPAPSTTPRRPVGSTGPQAPAVLQPPTPVADDPGDDTDSGDAPEDFDGDGPENVAPPAETTRAPPTDRPAHLAPSSPTTPGVATEPPATPGTPVPTSRTPSRTSSPSPSVPSNSPTVTPPTPTPQANPAGGSPGRDPPTLEPSVTPPPHDVSGRPAARTTAPPVSAPQATTVKPTMPVNPTASPPQSTWPVTGPGNTNSNAFAADATSRSTPSPVIISTSSSTPPPTVKITERPINYGRDLNTSRLREPQGLSAEQSAPEIIGGLDERRPEERARTMAVGQTYKVLQYVVGISVVISVVLLIGFHGVAVDERYDWYTVACSPTTWEFVVYVSYVQHLASLSQLVLVKTPPSLWRVMDGLAWTTMLPYHSNDSAISIAAAKAASASRRLETILLSGMVAFADRIGIKETDLLVRTVTGLAIFACVFLLFFFIFAAAAKRRMDFQNEHPSQRCDTQEIARTAFWRSITMRVCSLLVLLWFFALYPLCAVSSYEVSMELRAHAIVAGQLVLAVIAMPVLCLGGMLLVGYTVTSRSRSELSEPFHLAAWGSLYADYSYRKRAFLIAPVLLQIVTGVVVGAVGSDKVQVVLLIALFVVYLLALWVVRPFVQDCVAPWFVVVITLLKITNLAIALAGFTTENSWSSRARLSAADAIVFLNTIVVLAWLLRLGIMLVQTVRYMRTTSQENEAIEAERRRTLSRSLPAQQESPQYDSHAGGFLAIDSQRSFYDSLRSESSRGMTASLRSWKKHHMAIA